MDSIEKTVALNGHMLHLRPVQRIVEVAQTFGSKITLSSGSEESNAKSMLDMILFGAALENFSASHFVLRVEGEDRNEAMKALTGVMNELFGPADGVLADN